MIDDWMVLQRCDVNIQADLLGISWHSSVRVLISSCVGIAWVHTLAESLCRY